MAAPDSNHEVTRTNTEIFFFLMFRVFSWKLFQAAKLGFN